MRQFIEEKAQEAGLPNFGDADGFSSHFGHLREKIDTSASEEDQRAAKVKNISLQLLEIDSAQGVLDLFEHEFISSTRDASQYLQKSETAMATIDELFMFLYFFKI